MENKNLKQLNVKKMKCSRCLQQRIETEDGVCLICKPNIVHGKEIKESSAIIKHGRELKCRSGKVDENIWMR